MIAEEPLSSQDGSLIKSADADPIYVMQEGQKRWIPDPETFDAYGFDWGRVQVRLARALDAIPTSSPLPSCRNGSLIRIAGTDPIYVMQQGQKRWIPDAETFNAHGFDWGGVQEGLPGDLDEIPTGPPLPSVRGPAAPAPRPAMEKQTILFLAANPSGTDRLALDHEARAIQVELERSGNRDAFEFVTRWAVEPLDLLRELRKLKPTVVHFSGHGSRVGATEHGSDQVVHRDVVGAPAANDRETEYGLYFQDSAGHPRLVPAGALKNAFGAAAASVKLVVLNACYSEAQADALLEHVDCVVGMSGSIRDDSARAFAVGFYGGLGERESIAAAYEQGCAAIGLEGLSDEKLPQLKARAGVDPRRLILDVERR
jgi:CHAT domain